MPATACIEILLNSAQHVNDLPAVIPGSPVISPAGGCDAVAPGTLDDQGEVRNPGFTVDSSRETVCECDPRSKVGPSRPKVSRRRLVPPAPFQLVLSNRYDALACDEFDDAEPFLAATKQQNSKTINKEHGGSKHQNAN